MAERDPWLAYLLRTLAQCEAEADRLERKFHPTLPRMVAKLRYDARFIDFLIRGFQMRAGAGLEGVFEPRRGDAIRARCVATGRWMGGVIRAVSVREGFVSVCAGSYCFEDYDATIREVPEVYGASRYGVDKFPDSVRCTLEGATVVRGQEVYVEIYRDSDSVVYEHVVDASDVTLVPVEQVRPSSCNEKVSDEPTLARKGSRKDLRTQIQALVDEARSGDMPTLRDGEVVYADALQDLLDEERKK